MEPTTDACPPITFGLGGGGGGGSLLSVTMMGRLWLFFSVIQIPHAL